MSTTPQFSALAAKVGDDLYVGCRTDASREVFRSTTVPTQHTHGGTYVAVIGPFRTERGAAFMAAHGRGNPHVQTVDDAERIAAEEAAR